MAIDEVITKSKSMSESTSNFNMPQNDKRNKGSNLPARMGYLIARRHRIERWAYDGRSTSISARSSTTSATIGSISGQKRSESSFSQIDRKFNLDLVQLSEQRQKVIERRNFDQKIFANKQAIKYKENPAILKTLSYVRKCCKYDDQKGEVEDNIDPKIFLEENSSPKRSRSRSPSPTKRNLSMKASTQTSASLAETFLKHNQKYIRSYASSPISKKLFESKTSCNTPTTTNRSETIPTDDDFQKRHVQFRINTDGEYLICQSAHVNSKSRSYNEGKPPIRNVISADGIQPSNTFVDARPSKSAPPIRITSSALDSTSEQTKPSPKPRRPVSRISSATSSIQDFRRHPERYLSSSNRYLPLLLRQMTDIDSKESHNKQQKERIDSIRKRMNFSPPISRLSDGSDLTYDEAKSFLSEEIDIAKFTPRAALPLWAQQDRKLNKKFRPSSKIDLLQTVVEDTTERTMAMARLRDREYARLHELINTSPIGQILEPFSAIKTDENVQVDLEQQSASNIQRQPIQSTVDKLSMKSTKIRQLGDLVQSIDSLHCSDGIDGRKRRQVDMDKNREKLGILIF
ncbi:unnamed protein product [Rotaria socialis]|uniref:Uncharacterized protein n=1 Tax=Rotaria socialis TaxID=392032 RepID=A0A818QZU0_9BILA|nr:unnamed protein product [Rotaria socialis]CAF3649366.1 unnamed protein product [Rotaria socialis]CAF4114946.1 unnamed protein product [Rotaria socialis]CAF4531153.1 unnamed protein product [Rotaria socialis]